ncbi:MAG: hypothetical protein NT004_02245 [Bacteroidetes bacterium]|nr:hypothetical protein [Bacteroidota bacterium]
MFNSVVLDVVIGLVFIYLLYSLLATILSELIATKLGLRARNLKEAIDRMLNDEKETVWWFRLWDSMKLMKNPKNTVVNKFYNHPEIKYLGSSGVFKIPSTYKATSFSKTVMSMILGDAPMNKEEIERKLKEIVDKVKEVKKATEMVAIAKQSLKGSIKSEENSGTNKKTSKKALRDALNAKKKAKESVENVKIFDPETAEYIQNLWNDSYGDIVKFKLLMEGWFDRTMEQSIEWYKRKIQVVTFILGFCIAWFFCVDTFSIIDKLSVDKDARDKMVSMANAFVQNTKSVIDTSTMNKTDLRTYTQKLDSLLDVKKKLDVDIANANTILGLGAWLPDSGKVFIRHDTIICLPPIDNLIFTKGEKQTCNGKIGFTFPDKLCYFFYLFFHHFWGFLITAIAISLGAPFWFDLLNKLMKLRTSTKESTNSAADANANNSVSPLNREA